MACFLECGFDVSGIAKASNESTRFFFAVRLPEKESHLGDVSRFNLNCDPDGSASVEASANVAGQSFLFHRGRIAQRAITSDEPGPLSGARNSGPLRSGKRQPFAQSRSGVLP